MAYKVSEEYKKVIYSGEANHDLYVEYGGEVLKEASSRISNLKWVRKILSNGNKYFSLDNFIAQNIELIFYDYEVQDLTKEFYFKLGTMVNGKYEYVPIGYYQIKDNPTTANGKTTYKLIDRSKNFDFNYDGSKVIEQNGGSATFLQIVEDICAIAKVELASKNFPRYNKKTSFYDNTLTGRIHISYIAEKCGCIATINREGKLQFIEINKNKIDVKEIPELIINEKMSIGDKYKISKVSFDSGTILWNFGNDSADTLYINSTNLYITKEEDIKEIYNGVKEYEIYSINTNKMMGDPSIEPWDFIKYKFTDENGKVIKEVIGLGQYELTFNGAIMQTFETTIDRVAKNTNKTINSSENKIRRLRQSIDEVNGSLEIISEDINENKENIANLTIGNQEIKNSIESLDKKYETLTTLTKEVFGNPIKIENSGEYVAEELLIYGNEDGLSGQITLKVSSNTAKLDFITEQEDNLITEDLRSLVSLGYEEYEILYNIEEELLFYDDTYDTLDLVNGILTKRIGKDENNNLYLLENEQIIEVQSIEIPLYEKENIVEIVTNDEYKPNLKLLYLTDSELNGTFVTKSELKLTEDSIQTEVKSTQTLLIENVANVNTNLQNQITNTNEKLNNYATTDSLKTIQNSVSTIQTSLNAQIKVTEEIVENGVSKVKNTTGTFDEDGLHIEKTNAETKSTINEIGVSVQDAINATTEDLLFAGYVNKNKAEKNPKLQNFIGQTVTYTNNLIVSNYLITGNYSRMEDYEDGTGVFDL